MSRLWVNDGKLVIDSSGRPVLCDTCPCETGTGTGFNEACGLCVAGTLPAQWQTYFPAGSFSSSGFSCSGCANLNDKTHVLTNALFLGGANIYGCEWWSPDLNMGPTCANSRFRLFYDPSTTLWRFNVVQTASVNPTVPLSQGSALASWTAAAFVCGGPNPLAFNSGGLFGLLCNGGVSTTLEAV